MPLHNPCLRKRGAHHLRARPCLTIFLFSHRQSMPDIVRHIYSDAHSGLQPTDDFIAAFLDSYFGALREHELEVGPPPMIEIVVRIARAAVKGGTKVAVATSGVREILIEHFERFE